MAHFAKMVDMARTPADVKKEIDSYPSASNPESTVPAYPYGLCITLDQESLDKLDIEGGCAVGDMIHLCAIARVTSCNESETEKKDGTKERKCRIELQITHLATEGEDDELADMDAMRQKKVKRRYGASDAGGEDDE
jgi:hypothetical protein